jgi:hypothetical protein
MGNDGEERGLSTHGRVVEILERGGERFARIVIASGTVIEIPAASGDLTLGDRVIVDSSFTAREESHRSAAAPMDPQGKVMEVERGETQIRPALRDYAHVLRIAGVFAVAIASFLAWRAWMVPADFGKYGHYRAGAMTEIAARTPVYAGQALCVTCHEDVHQQRQAGRHARIGCEACHGPLGQHARGESDVAPIRPSSRGVCLTCHTARVGMPATFPKVIVKEHSDAGPCTDCHMAHAPGLS